MSAGTMSRVAHSASGALCSVPAGCALQATSRLRGDQVPRARQVSLDDGRVGRLEGRRDGAGVATVGDHRETERVTPCVEDAAQLVVAERVVFVEIGRVGDVVAVIGFLAVFVGDVGAVTGEVPEQRIAALSAADQPGDGLLGVFFVAAKSLSIEISSAPNPRSTRRPTSTGLRCLNRWSSSSSRPGWSIDSEMSQSPCPRTIFRTSAHRRRR
jgi:hypothetical protein